MMTQPRLLPLKWLGALTSAVALAAVASAQPAPGSLEDQQVRVQITEVSLLRTQLLIDTNTTEIAQVAISDNEIAVRPPFFYR